MKVLIVGGGGREHAIAWALHREDPAVRLSAAPGNPGLATLATLLPIPADDIDRLTEAAVSGAFDLTVIGPEVPLALGLADRLRARGRLAFGPSAAAAALEASKAFSKDVMEAAGIPTAASRTFTDLAGALAYVDAHAEPLFARIVEQGLPAEARLDHVVVEGAGHFSFVSAYPPALASPAIPPSQDPEGFDRTAYLPVLFGDIARFLGADPRP